ncbi:hypothetical protein I5102_003423 [Pseudomonas aeruginosa]|uniref:hypothetical protein n=1 Tax=Pseudomonas aeruginosa TaxID=287 RepID=UPI0018B02BEF|nr:hypothetical protein [Pseudomonas aeruginosa]QPP24932.1 hypothetical protein I5102_003423 [Pseudomonas aeruginosa]
MRKQSHTPGPWVSRNNMVFGGKKCICSNVNAASPTLQNIAEDVAMSIANARLMAAAPELLSIAKRWAALDSSAWHLVRYEEEKRELLAATNEAIAKATA